MVGEYLAPEQAAKKNNNIKNPNFFSFIFPIPDKWFFTFYLIFNRYVIIILKANERENHT